MVSLVLPTLRAYPGQILKAINHNTMPKKEVEVVEEVAVEKPALITEDFGRDGLNALRDAVNHLLSK